MKYVLSALLERKVIKYKYNMVDMGCVCVCAGYTNRELDSLSLSMDVCVRGKNWPYKVGRGINFLLLRNGEKKASTAHHILAYYVLFVPNSNIKKSKVKQWCL